MTRLSLFAAILAVLMAVALSQSPSPISTSPSEQPPAVPPTNPVDPLNITALNVNDPAALKATLQAMLNQYQENKAATDTAINNGWMLITSTLIFFMQVGFTSLEAGSVSWKRSVPEIIIKTVSTSVLSAILWWLIGFGVAFGNGNGNGTGNGFIGDSYFAKTLQSARQEDTFSYWFFQWTFCGASATIVSGAVAERSRLTTYAAFVVLMSSLIYPIIAHWAWSTVGWMSAFNANGIFLGNNFVDFAGSGVVHMSGGTAALVLAYFIGPRKNRFTDTWKRRGISLFNSQDQSWVALGTFFLWFGWYGFNGGSTLLLTNGGWAISGLVFVNTTLSGVFGGVIAMAFARFMDKQWDLNSFCNGTLAGLVSITAGCAVVDTWAAVIIGFVGGAIYFWFARLLVRLHVDDPVDASPLHLGAGIWGVIAVGLFMGKDHVQDAYGRSQHYGLFMGGGGEQLAIQLIGMLVIFGWSGLLTTIFALIARKLGLLRMSKEKEQRHYEDHLFANKAEEGFASVVTYNKKKQEKTAADVNAEGDVTNEDKESGEELPDLGSSDSSSEPKSDASDGQKSADPSEDNKSASASGASKSKSNSATSSKQAAKSASGSSTTSDSS